jgi:hypothetical protein
LSLQAACKGGHDLVAQWDGAAAKETVQLLNSGGGGGGYYGGGGGCGGSGTTSIIAEGGGGSSSVEPSALRVHMIQGAQKSAGNGLVVISWQQKAASRGLSSSATDAESLLRRLSGCSSWPRRSRQTQRGDGAQSCRLTARFARH